MKAFGFTPDRNYLFKRFTQLVWIAIIVVIAILFTGQKIGYWINPSVGARWGIITSIAFNIVWLGLATSLIYQNFNSLFYEIHEGKVIVHTGVITQSVTHVPFHMITDLRVRRSPLDRLFKLGTIDIRTAAKDDHHRATECLVGLRNFREVYDLVTTAMKQNHNHTLPMQEEDQPVSSEADMLRSLLAEMRDIRMLLRDQNTYLNRRG
jgi:membrane protein YdbS with pleckstrin-like domain